MKNLLMLSCCILALASGLDAQKAIIYSVTYKVSENMIDIPDLSPLYTEEERQDDVVPYMGRVNLSDQTIRAICKSFTSMVKQEMGYTEVEVLYQREGVSSHQTGRQSGFPQRLLKFTSRQNKADSYIKLILDISGRSNIKYIGLFPKRWKLMFDMSSEITIYDKNLEIVDQKSVYINNFDELFAVQFATEMQKDKYVIKGKGYFDHTDLYELYKIAEAEYVVLLSEI